MQTVLTIGLDIAKAVSQVNGLDEAGASDYAPAVEASLRVGVLSDVATVPSRH